jgi:protein-S-isoprenylcysteine O-methyltransferase Ste14
MTGVVHHIRFFIFDWSVPNIIIGAIIIVVFFAAAWTRLPKWIERGRERSSEKRRGK